MASGGNSEKSGAEAVEVVLSPYTETPLFYRTNTKVGGAKRWFEKSKVSVVSRDPETIVLSMPREYAETRAGIASLIRSGKGRTRPVSAPAGRGFRESSPDWDPGLPERLDIQMGPGGRIVIPAVFRDAMQVKEGDRLMARLVGGELRLITPRMGVKLAQKLVRETITGDESLVDTLMEMRRREVADEFSNG